MKGSTLARTAVLALLLTLVAGSSGAVDAAPTDDDLAPQPVAGAVAIDDGPSHANAIAGLEDVESALAWDGHRREYALVAAIALLLAGAAIAFSLPPRH